MRTTALIFAAALGLAATPVAAFATPAAADGLTAAAPSAAIVQADARCGPWHRWIPGHRVPGGFVRPHCIPIRHPIYHRRHWHHHHDYPHPY